MKELDLLELGFQKQLDDDFYYYTLDIGNDFTPFCLISNANDETDNGQWFVEIFDYQSFRFTSRYQLEQFISTLKYAQVTKETIGVKNIIGGINNTDDNNPGTNTSTGNTI